MLMEAIISQCHSYERDLIDSSPIKSEYFSVLSFIDVACLTFVVSQKEAYFTWYDPLAA